MLNKIFAFEFWQYKIFGNIVSRYAISFLAFVTLTILLKIFQVFILRRLSYFTKQTKTDIDDTFIEIVKSLKPPFYSFLAFYIALNFLQINLFIQNIINAVLIIWVTYQVIIAIQILINYIVKKLLIKKGGKETQSAIGVLSIVTKSVIWTIGILLILSNMGVNITSVIAGLGIGGIAVALAVQNILSDLLSSFAIYFDKPFVIGDFIIVDDKMGIVERIGIKTTRIRALQGEEIVISNNELTAAKIQNFKNMRERRIVFNFGVTYETPTEKLKKIPKIIKNIIQSIKSTRFDRAHFYKFNDSALSFEVVYFVQTGDYKKYMDINQAIHLKIKESFEKEGISMAYPTKTVYLHQQNI